MKSHTEKLRQLLLVFLTFVFLTSIFSVVTAKPNQKKSDDFAISENSEEDEGEEDGEEEDEEEEKLTPEQIAAQKKAEEERIAAIKQKREQLEKDIKAINSDAEIIALLQKKENDEPVKESAVLLKRLLEALLNEKKPNYTEIGNIGKALCGLQKDSSIGLYAQGLAELNKTKKPDPKKALNFFSKAKDAKDPYKDAESAYKSCWIKANLLFIIIFVVIVIAVVAGIIYFVILTIKKKKAENNDSNNEINLQELINENNESNSILKEEKETVDLDKELTSNDSNQINIQTTNTTTTNNNPNSDIQSQVVNLPNTSNSIPKENSTEFIQNSNEEKITPKIEEKPSNQSNQQQIETSSLDLSENEKIPTYDNSSVTPKASQSTPTKKIVRVVKKVRVRKDANGNSYVVSEETTPKVDYENDNTYSDNGIDKNAVKSILKPVSRPLPPIDSQLDQIWDKLSQKALQGHIEQLARPESSLPSINKNDLFESKIESFEDQEEKDDAVGKVSIDLSDDALKDDLIGKLKMLAISESELRELFAMKNPAHIPHLIEYIMTKPEPARLAFVAKELGNYNDPAIVDALSTLLYHEDERVVLAAIQGLEATKMPIAVVPLCPFLKSDIPLFAQAARTALSKFGAVKIIQAFKDLTNFKDNKLKESAIFVLSRMKGEAVEELLKSLLKKDESSEVIIQTILAMSYQKNPVYVEPLREFYKIANEKEKSITRKAIVYLNGFKS